MLAIERTGLVLNRALRWVAAFLVLLVPLVFLIGAPALFLIMEEGLPILRLPFLALPFLVVAFLLGAAGAFLWSRGDRSARCSSARLASFSLVLAAYPLGMPMLKAINLSPRLAEAARATGCADPAYATVGYREPSLVFLTRTDILMAEPAEAAAFLERPGSGCRIAFIERRFEERSVRASRAIPPRRW